MNKAIKALWGDWKFGGRFFKRGIFRFCRIVLGMYNRHDMIEFMRVAGINSTVSKLTLFEDDK